MVNTTEYQSNKPTPRHPKTKLFFPTRHKNVNFQDPFIKNKITLLSCLIISWLFLLFVISGASSGIFSANTTSNGIKTKHEYGWSNRRKPTFEDLNDLNSALGACGGFFGFIIIMSWLFITIFAMMVYLYLYHDHGKVFQIGNRLIHHNHVIFYGLIIIESFLLIAIILYHSEFDKYMNNNYKDSSIEWWPSWASFFSYFTFLLILFALFNINGVIIEPIHKDDEIANMKLKEVKPIIEYNSNQHGNSSIPSNTIITVDNIPNNQDDGYESDEEELGLTSNHNKHPHNNNNNNNNNKDVVDLEIDDGDDQTVGIIRS